MPTAAPQAVIPSFFPQASQVESVSTDDKNKDIRIREVYGQYRLELCQYLVRQFGLDAAEAEDVIQVVFIRVAETNIILSLDNPRAFLYKMASNTTIDLKRREKVRNTYSAQVIEEGEQDIDYADPARKAEAGEQLELISVALKNMPEKRRTLLLMSRLDGMSYAEIARQVKLSETVVRKHIFKALAECQEAIKSQRKRN